MRQGNFVCLANIPRSLSVNSVPSKLLRFQMLYPIFHGTHEIISQSVAGYKKKYHDILRRTKSHAIEPTCAVCKGSSFTPVTFVVQAVLAQYFKSRQTSNGNNRTSSREQVSSPRRDGSSGAGRGGRYTQKAAIEKSDPNAFIFSMRYTVTWLQDERFDSRCVVLSPKRWSSRNPSLFSLFS